MGLAADLVADFVADLAAALEVGLAADLVADLAAALEEGLAEGLEPVVEDSYGRAERSLGAQAKGSETETASLGISGPSGSP